MTRRAPGARGAGEKQAKALRSDPGAAQRAAAGDPAASVGFGLKWMGWPVLIPLLLVTRAAMWILLPHAAEDAYITFRYSRNLVEGLGLVFNPGERVMGFTSPLWTLWCALGVAITRDPVTGSRATAVACDMLSLVLICRLLLRHASSASAWCFGVFFAAWPYFAGTTVSGMEMPAFLAAIVAAYTLSRSRSVWAGPCLAAVALMRPEGIACALVLGVAAGWRDRVVALAIVAVGIGALTAAYGSPVPQSLLAKAKMYGTPGALEGRYWWEWLVPLDLGRWPTTQEGIQLFSLRLLVAPASVIAIWRLRQSWLLVLALACLVPWAGYALLGVAFFFWYLFVPLAGFAMLSAIALPTMVRGRWAYVVIGILIASTWATQPPKIYIARAREEERLFGTASQYLAEAAKPGETILLEPIGRIGYENPKLIVLDEIGLVTPELAKRRAQGPGWYSDALRSYRPDWIAIRYQVLNNQRGFAGIGAPFRNAAEADSVTSEYRVRFKTQREPGPNDLAVARRLAP